MSTSQWVHVRSITWAQLQSAKPWSQSTRSHTSVAAWCSLFIQNVLMLYKLRVNIASNTTLHSPWVLTLGACCKCEVGQIKGSWDVQMTDRQTDRQTDRDSLPYRYMFIPCFYICIDSVLFCSCWFVLFYGICNILHVSHSYSVFCVALNQVLEVL